MDVYEDLLAKTKRKLQHNVDSEYIVKETDTIFTLLEDCRSCVHQALELTAELVEEESFSKVIFNLEESTSILRLLSIFIKKLMEDVTISFNTSKSFPLTVGEIIHYVFIHCKSSELSYGEHLSKFEKQLKDLFRYCHELQLIYLMVLEKYYVFTSSNEEELQLLVTVLKLNLNIGEIVLNLDIKTMAEQWKALSAICCKYSKDLLDTDFYNCCLDSLCDLILNNVVVSAEAQQEQLMNRSIKVTNFLLKIFIKLLHIFKDSTSKNHQELIFLMCNIKMYCKRIDNEKDNRNEQFRKLFETNVVSAVDDLLKIVLLDESFVSDLIKYNVIVHSKESNRRQAITMNTQYDNLEIGYIFLIVTVLQTLTKNENNDEFFQSTTIEDLIKLIFNTVSFSYKYLNVEFTLHNDLKNNRKVYDCLLIHSAIILLNITSDQYEKVDRLLFEVILSTDCFLALFASDLWTILLRLANTKLRYDQLIYLCQVYCTLQRNQLFSTSPQQVHLSYTIRRLFSSLSVSEKNKIANDILAQGKSYDVLSVFEVKNLPQEQCERYENIIQKELVGEINNFLSAKNYNNQDFDNLICLLNVTSTCKLASLDDQSKKGLLKLWSKLCTIPICHLEWFTSYFRALAGIIERIIVCDHVTHDDLVEILHVLTTLKQNTLIDLTILSFLSHLSVSIDNYYSSLVKNTLYIIFKNMLDNNTNEIVILKTRATLKTYSNTKYYNSSLKQLGKYVQLEDSSDISLNLVNFAHKCITVENVNDNNEISELKCGSIDDFADVDLLFSSDTEEPANKRMKLDNEGDIIVQRLENETELLLKLDKKLNTHLESRIYCLCEKLKAFTS